MVIFKLKNPPGIICAYYIYVIQALRNQNKFLTGNIASLVKQRTTPIHMGGESLGATGK
jgi:hypothetical protein